MTWAVAINIIAAIGGLAGLSSFLNIFLSKNKVRAEAADIEQSVSDKVLKNVRDDNILIRAERDEVKAEIEKVRDEFQLLRQKMSQYEVDQWETRMLVIRLINWSKVAYTELHTQGSTLEEPPTKDLMDKFNTKK